MYNVIRYRSERQMESKKNIKIKKNGREGGEEDDVS